MDSKTDVMELRVVGGTKRGCEHVKRRRRPMSQW